MTDAFTLLSEPRRPWLDPDALKARVKDQDVDTGGLETLVFLKSDGRWRIRPSHTSARRRPEG